MFTRSMDKVAPRCQHLNPLSNSGEAPGADLDLGFRAVLACSIWGSVVGLTCSLELASL